MIICPTVVHKSSEEFLYLKYIYVYMGPRLPNLISGMLGRYYTLRTFILITETLPFIEQNQFPFDPPSAQIVLQI